MKTRRLEAEATSLRRLRPKPKASNQETNMVFHTAGKKDNKLKQPTVRTSQPENVGPEQRNRQSNCQLAASIFFNIIMLLMLIGAGLYLTRQRHKICDLQVQYDSERLEELGIPYEVKHCHAEPMVTNHDTFQSEGQRSEDSTNEGVIELDVPRIPTPLQTEQDTGNEPKLSKKQKQAGNIELPNIDEDERSGNMSEFRRRQLGRKFDVSSKPKVQHVGLAKKNILRRRGAKKLHRSRDKSSFHNRRRRGKISPHIV